MRDFDQEIAERHAERERLLERKFKLCAQTFLIDVNPPINSLREFEIDEASFVGMDLIDFYIAAIGKLISTPDRQKWVKLMAKKDLSLTSIDLENLYMDVIGMAYARPTQASLPSGDGRVTTGENSKENSSSEPAVASVA